MNTTKKRRILSAVSAAAMLSASALTAFAADTQSGTTTLTVQKAPSYTMTIPMSQDITFGTVDTAIGALSVTGNIGAAQKVSVTAAKTEFIDMEDAANSFAFELREGTVEFLGKEWTSQEVKDDMASAELTVHIPSETWGNTSPATYEAQITFQASLTDGN